MVKYRIRFLGILLFCFLFSLINLPVKAQELNQNTEEQYVDIVTTIKKNPKQAINDLKNLTDKNNSAAIEYLILLSIYEPQKVNTPEFEQIA